MQCTLVTSAAQNSDVCIILKATATLNNAEYYSKAMRGNLSRLLAVLLLILPVGSCTQVSYTKIPLFV